MTDTAPESAFPDWEELDEAVRRTLRAAGFDQHVYDSGEEKERNAIRASALWVIPWDDLSSDIRATYEGGGVSREEFEASQAETQSVGFCVGLELRGASAEEVRAIVLAAAAFDFNRQLADWAVTALDEDGLHGLAPVLVHRHINGKIAEPHMRVHAYLKLRGKTEPTEVVLDVPMEHFNKLRTGTEVKEALGLPVGDTEGEWNAFLRSFWEIVEESGGPEALKLVRAAA